MRSLEELKQLADETAATAREAAAAYRKALLATCEFAVGDIIRSAKGDLARVVAIEIGFSGEPRPVAVLQKKNGEFGGRHASMWRSEWDRPMLHQRTVDAP